MPRPANYGQIFRAVNLTSEDCLYHYNTPTVNQCVSLGGTGAAAAWLQWTQAPPSTIDLDFDGHNEINVRSMTRSHAG